MTEELKERLTYELNTIKTMGYGLLLIVYDFINSARDTDIMVGPGRGFCGAWKYRFLFSGITQLDPIRYQLLFERFLNPERVSMPDIDIDFCFERRQEVIDYVVKNTERTVCADCYFWYDGGSRRDP